MIIYLVIRNNLVGCMNYMQSIFGFHILQCQMHNYSLDTALHSLLLNWLKEYDRYAMDICWCCCRRLVVNYLSIRIDRWWLCHWDRSRLICFVCLDMRWLIGNRSHCGCLEDWNCNIADSIALRLTNWDDSLLVRVYEMISSEKWLLCRPKRDEQAPLLSESKLAVLEKKTRVLLHSQCGVIWLFQRNRWCLNLIFWCSVIFSECKQKFVRRNVYSFYSPLSYVSHGI